MHFFSFSNSLKFEWDGIAHWFFKTILNYPNSNLPNLLKVEGIDVNLNEIRLLEKKNNCYLYIFK